MSEAIRRANQGDSTAFLALLWQHRYAPTYVGTEESSKAGAILAAGIVGLITKNPVYTLATYGGVNAGLTSIHRQESLAHIIGKTFIGAASGYALGKLGTKIGAETLLGQALVDGTGETALDTIVSGLNGENISLDELASNFAGNVVANVLFGLAGRAISNITGSKAGNAVDSVEDVATGSLKTFKPGELEIHYNKHGKQLANVLNEPNYTMEQYLKDANNIIQKGTYIPEMNGYVTKIGGSGKSTKYAFVGLDRATGNITTYHVKYAKQILKKSPSFEVTP
ncbi:MULTISPECIES: hypothetical protein [unclassified Streptococcus]|uniref:hypothetical protein n=1 Tax=unclassified Streptococcus TaxID=2608887 RepID=UPI0010727EBD|nr:MULTISPECIES: hypothetical protein [unclassified Streptococcus]MBF0786847.1 hypothetical protein [Streptococcus sp. 19428wC2_LYSM12]MCQ9212745.1 hypothetical protein [Streptococcus sp. B01]MCQ9214086.1 hypothetical protein [Streptococcus sp. O1]TFV06217.1 hypothetical protein E4T79_02810 [Streptococcus sp. LYSM12]